MANHLRYLKELLEYLGGVAQCPPTSAPNWLQGPVFWGLWWATLILLMLAFSGQTSKFIYIDF